MEPPIAKPLSTTTIYIAAGVLVVVAFLVGYLPGSRRGSALSAQLNIAHQQADLAELRDLAGLLYLQASQKDYGLAATTSSRFFERTSQLALHSQLPGRKQPLEDLLQLRDPITAAIAQADPSVLGALQALFLQTRHATLDPVESKQGQ
jgi:hypothetical protein